MLQRVQLDKKLTKAEYREKIAPLELRLGELQRELRAAGIPTVIAFEGWDAAGKGTLINRLMLALDPRGFKVHPISAPTEEEKRRPYLWRFWIKTPEKGRIAIFDRSWYSRVLVERIDRIVKPRVWTRAYDEINSFERQLIDDNCIMIKFFLHISKKEQKKRFKKLKSNSSLAWKVTREDRRHHRQYDQYLKATEEMLEKTSTDQAPWHIIEAHDRRFATVKLFSTLVEAMENKLREAAKHRPARPAIQLQAVPDSILDSVDLSRSISREDYREQHRLLSRRMMELEHEIYLRRIPVIIAYEGWDAAGKGGNIRRLVQAMDPRGYEVVPIAAPSDEEKSHHYLWRFWKRVPKAGHITIFDRTWYGRVMVERVEKFCRTDEWKRAYREINEMEEQWCRFGVILIKFWLHIDPDEQLARFRAREQTPHKQWKITDEDWRNRKKTAAYREAVDELLFRTDTTCAPWTIIESNNKPYARIKTLGTVVARIEDRL